ncbi:lysosomal alpha-mannosidase isoform X2 [Bicyclus anynana]|uniref:alpha-mannosidase n=1 Tax=Bicyclus anynana TaxID=110368 RepID=A0ABM3M429_BICAN|nr:lysosomal alpha-mannosidase isoform X2 [Bicyclus anynana]
MRCCVPFCENTSDNMSTSERTGITFHALPSEDNLRTAWLRALGTQDHHLPDPAVVCSQHFLDDDFYTTESCVRQIHSNAVPSIVQMCMICLDSDSKLSLMSKHKLEEAYEQLTGLSLFQLCRRGNLKQTLCVMCAQRLINFSRFRDLSLRAHSLLTDSVELHASIMLLPLLLIYVLKLSSGVPLTDDISPRRGEKCGYESCTQAESGLLNVHIVPHTHDDVGWLKTVDQYYYGSRNNIQKAGVQYILDSVIQELWQDPKRRFIYVETAFFWKWWVRQTEEIRQKVHTLVRQGRLQFVGGAWSMNDEAASHYQSTIDQFTWGLRKLNDTFGPCGMPKVGWQIDPFGHSREFASLLAAMGYDGLFLGRLDYQDKGARLAQKRMEMIWRGDDDLGNSSDLFTGVLFNTYSPPPGFCFDVLCDDEPIIDDPSSPMFNVDARVKDFLDICRNMSKGYSTNNILVTMGEDFFYQDAGMDFKNLDKLIEYTNMKAAKDGLNIKLFYSTPDCYLKAVKDANPTLPTKQDDFFPYASDPTAYWTGYFTSRPTTKYFERQGNGYLQMVKHLQVMANLEQHNEFVLNELKSAMGVMQHHDAITGTEKQHVAHDYERLLNSAIEDATIIARQAFNKLAQDDASEPPLFAYERCRLNESSCAVSETTNQFVVTIYNPLAWDTKEPIRIPVKFGKYEVFAPNAEKIDSQLVDIPEAVKNIPTRKSEATHEIVFIAKLHAMGVKSFFVKKINQKRKRDTRKNDYYTNISDYWKNIRDKTNIDIQNIEDVDIKNSYFPIRDSVLPDKYSSNIDNIPILVNYGNNIDGKVNVVKEIDIDLLKDKKITDYGVGEFERIIKEVYGGKSGEGRSFDRRWSYPSLSEDEMRMLSDEPRVVERYDEFYLENEFMKLRIDNETGQITHMILPDRTTNLKIQFSYWTGCYGDNTNTTLRSSGAYIFRPKTKDPYKIAYKNNGTIKGNVVYEVRATTNENAFTTLRLYKDLNFVEHDFVIGPININDNVGKEYIVRYETDVNNKDVFYTDSNGRQLLKRILNKRSDWNLTLAEPIAGNYYPVTNEIAIEDNNNRIAILTDRSVGATSLNNGELEVMVHRRLLHDDAFGVGEALNETANGVGLVIRGVHRILNIDPKNDEELILERKYVIANHLKPVVFVSNAENVPYETWINLNNCFKGIKPLPLGLHLLTLEPWDDKVLIRLENYLEKSDNSTIEIDLSDVFNNLKIKSIRETSLAVNRWVGEMEKWVWNKENDFSDSFNNAYGADYDNNSDWVKNDGKLKHEDNGNAKDDGLKVKVEAKQIRTFLADYDYIPPITKSKFKNF